MGVREKIESLREVALLQVAWLEYFRNSDTVSQTPLRLPSAWEWLVCTDMRAVRGRSAGGSFWRGPGAGEWRSVGGLSLIHTERLSKVALLDTKWENPEHVLRCSLDDLPTNAASCPRSGSLAHPVLARVGAQFQWSVRHTVKTLERAKPGTNM